MGEDEMLNFVFTVFDFGESQAIDYETPELKITQKLQELTTKSIGGDKKDFEKEVAEYESFRDMVKEQEKNRKDFSYYMDESKKCLLTNFGQELYDEICNVKLVPINWEGDDITTCSILATTPSIKERFNKGWVEYFTERDYSMLDLLLQSIFHLGYQHTTDTVVEALRRDINTWSKRIKED
jgi:hypothetical protein